MPEIVIDFTPDAILYKQPKKLAATLGFTNERELRNFVKGPRFHPLFEQYAELCIYSQQNQANRIRNARERGPSVKAVKQRIIAGEQPESDKFSATFPDKKE